MAVALGREEGEEDGAQAFGQSDWVYGRGSGEEEGEDLGAGYIFLFLEYFLSFDQVPRDRTPRKIRHSSEPEKPEFTHIKKKPVRVGP